MVFSNVNVKHLFIVPILFINSYVLAQAPDYWQQRTDYQIAVALDDAQHLLHGNITINYTNNSPDVLSFLYFHLWPNAYKNNGTAFAKQMAENNKLDFYYSTGKQRGYIDSLLFTVDGKVAQWALDSTNIDICKIVLPESLRPGETITISTPFKVKIPNSFSRLGHVGQSYQISQWYPKPAVYDKDGWHPMPYLDQGEFYSEFGDFDVSITLPENYVVGASGDLQDEEELEWLDSIAEASKNYRPVFRLGGGGVPASSTQTKTIQYHLTNAHDFAWFADKRFHVLKGSVTLPNSEKEVTTWAMFTDVNAQYWKNSLSYLHDAIYWYSKWIGDYQYNQVTAVEGALSAGGGMEYPTITIIGKVNSESTLEDVLVHEVGHNWFYGMLGTNERRYPWMDEGINSYYEYRYLENKYPEKGLLGVPKGLARFLDVAQYRHNYLNELAYLFSARQNLDQAMGLPADKYTELNYGAIIYMKSALAMNHLASYMGQDVFDKGMQAYFDDWKMRHPYPADMKASLEISSGKDLGWFFDTLAPSSGKLDYAIKNLDKNGDSIKVTVTNKANLTLPYSISAFKNDSIVATVWYEGTPKDATVNFPKGDYDFLRLDGNMQMVEYNRNNDSYRLKGLMHKAERIRFQFLGSLDNPYKNQLMFTPALGWNNYDKVMLGVALYNHFIPDKAFEYELLPMYAVGTNTFVGAGRIGYTWTPFKSKVRTLNFSVFGKRFSYQRQVDELQYNKIQPQLTLTLKKRNPRSPLFKTLTLRSVTIFQDVVEYDLFDPSVPAIKSKRNLHYTINEATFEWDVKRKMYPLYAKISLQQGNDFVRTSLESNYQLTYNRHGGGINLRLFAGGFIWNDDDPTNAPDPGFHLSYGTGIGQFQKDYLFDELFLGRNETNGFLSQQILIKDAGFRTPNPYGSFIRNWVTSLGISIDPPGKTPIKPYFNLAAFGNKGTVAATGETIDYATIALEGGISVVLFKNNLEINFPIFFLLRQTDDRFLQSGNWYFAKKSDDKNNILRGRKYGELITFTLNFNNLNPLKLVKTITF
ncbi:MAG: M1 family metallopeptidase [Chitinophagales bacterium]|nr:M1 family metallopeptidase [Chitinophagales bacterium]